MAQSVSSPRPTHPPGLAREAIGLREVFFQSVTHMAPAAAVAFSIIFGAPFAGGALPLAVILALIGCLLVAVSIGQLAKQLPSAGSFYTYTARGLHPSVGFMVAWGYAVVEPLVAPLLYLIFGHLVATVLNQEFGWRYSQWWWVAALFAAIVVFLLGYFGIQISARTGTLLGLFEIGVFTALAIWLIAKAPTNTPVGVRHEVRQRHRLQGILGGGSRIDLHDPRVHRLRGGGAARRGDARPAREHQAGGRLFLHRHRHLLRVHHVRGGRVLRSGEVRGVRVVRRREPVGRPGPQGVGGGVGGRLPGHRQLGHRQLERGGERHHPDVVRHGPDPPAAVDLRAHPTPTGGRRTWR